MKDDINFSYKKNLEKKETKKINLKTKTDNALKSLNEVEHFLRNFNKLSDLLKFSKIIKKNIK